MPKVHITLSGMITIQRVKDDSGIPFKWRIVVPDFAARSGEAGEESHHSGQVNPANDHHHDAFLAYLEASSPAGPAKVVPLREMTMTLAGAASAGSTQVPAEVVQFPEILEQGDPPEAGKVKAWGAIKPVPALQLWLGEADTATTYISSDREWVFERDKSNGVDEKLKGAVAEEICFSYDTNESTLRLLLDDRESPRSIDVEAIDGIIEIAIRNISPDTDTKFGVDPHFGMYYGLLKGQFARPARLKSRGVAENLPKFPDHAHKLQKVDVKGDLTTLAKSRGPIEKQGVSGSNCPPGSGDPYP